MIKRLAVFPVLVTAAASVCLILFAPRLFQAVGTILLSLAVSYPVLALLHFHPFGWTVESEGKPFTLFSKKAPDFAIQEELLKGALHPEGDLLLPGGTYPVSRIRSLPGGILLCAAIAATYTDSRKQEDLASLFPEMNLSPEQFRLKFPFLRSLHLASAEGKVVQDGTGERVFFCMDSSERSTLDFLQHCTLIQDQGKARAITENEKRQLPDLPLHTMLFFTGLPRGNQVDGLTFLGGIAFRYVQRYREEIVRDVQSLKGRGQEVFLTHPVQVSSDTILSACPVPVHEPGPHTFSLTKDRDAANAVSLWDACIQLSNFRLLLRHLYWVLAAFHASAAFLILLSPLPAAAAVLFQVLPLVFLLISAARPLHDPCRAPSRSSSISVYAVLLADCALLFLLIFFIGTPAWQKACAVHALGLSCVCTLYLHFSLHPGRLSPVPAVVLGVLGTLAVSAACWFLLGPESVFVFLLACLSGLILAAVRNPAAHGKAD